MQKKFSATLDAGRRARAFRDAHADAIGNALTPTLSARLDAAVAELEAQQMAQEAADSSTRSGTRTVATLATAVVDQFILPVRRILATIKPKVPDAEALSASLNTRLITVFVAKAQNAAKTSRAYRELFGAHGMTPDFPDRFAAAVAELVDAMHGRDQSKGAKVTATAGLERSDRDLKGVLGLVDAVLAPAFKSQPALLAGWRSSARIKQISAVPARGGTAAENLVVGDGGGATDASGEAANAPAILPAA